MDNLGQYLANIILEDKIPVSKLNESQTATIGEFIKYAIKNLAIKKPPSGLTLSYDNNQAKDRSSFGYFDPNNNKIWVYVKNRNMADILRTLAHELVHRKQDENGKINYESGETGSDIENEANAQAGILLRNFGKEHKEIYESLNKNLNEYSSTTINKLILKFKQENPNLKDNDIKEYIKRFNQIKNNLPIEKRDILKYSWNELEQIISNIQSQQKRIKAGKLNDGEPEDANLIYNKNGLRVYIGKTKQACIKYGNGYSFCISARGEDNLYYDYTYEGRGLPYFIFDDTKSSKQNENGKFIDPTHLLVLFVYDDDMEEYSPYTHFTITNANNDPGEKEYSDFWAIEADYPRLKGLRRLFRGKGHVEEDPIEKAEYKLNQKYTNKLSELNRESYKDQDFYNFSKIGKANTMIDNLLDNKIEIYYLNGKLKPEIDELKYHFTEMGLYATIDLKDPKSLENNIKDFTDMLIQDSNGYKSEENIKDWKVTYKKENIPSSYLNKVKELVDEYRKELTKLKLVKEGVYGDYLFGDKKTGVKIGWYNSEKEKDTPAEKFLFQFLKQYADSNISTYSTLNLDSYVPIFKTLKKQYPELVDPKISPDQYIYRGTFMDKEQLDNLLKTNSDELKNYEQGIIIPNQQYVSKRQVQSWSTSYYTASGFAYTNANEKGGVPVIMRAKAGDAELFFNPKFMEKLNNQLEDETFNIINPIDVDIMVIQDYKDEFEDIESSYLSNK